MGDKIVLQLEQVPSKEKEGEVSYVVKKLQNTTHFSIGEVLNKDRVNDLCNITTYEVKIS